MKLFVLKLASLVMLIAGLVLVGQLLNIEQINGLIDQIPVQLDLLKAKLPPYLGFAERLLELQILKIAGAFFLLVMGIYGFLPRLPKRTKTTKIVFNGSHGDVEIQLESVQATLNSVLAKMPEVRKINVKVTPAKDGRQATIHADVVLEHQPDRSARETATLVSDYIAETATTMLGLEELADIKLNIQGIHVNAKRSVAAIRDEHERLAAANALPAPPDAIDAQGRSVEAPEEEEETTENTPSYGSRLDPLAATALDSEPAPAVEADEDMEEEDEDSEAESYEADVEEEAEEEAPPAVSPLPEVSLPPVAEAPEASDAGAAVEEAAEPWQPPSIPEAEEENTNLEEPREEDSLLGFSTDTDDFSSTDAAEKDDDDRTAFESQIGNMSFEDDTPESREGESVDTGEDTGEEPAPKKSWW